MGAYDNPEGAHTIIGTVQFCCIAYIAEVIYNAWSENCNEHGEAVAADKD